MASIRKRTRADGTTVFTAEIVVKKQGIIVHRESKTFNKQKLAKDWAIRRETELQETEVYKRPNRKTIRELIHEYLDKYPQNPGSKLNQLKHLAKLDIADTDIHQLTTKTVIDHIRKRRETCQSSTAKSDVIWLKTVITTMAAANAEKYDTSVIDQASKLLSKEGLIGNSKRRDRRPTRAELWALSRHLKPKYLHIMWFAIYSCRRVSEILSLRWADINHEKRTILVRNMKSPNVKGLSKRAKLPRSAYKIIMRQPQDSEFIFPQNLRSFERIFSDACKFLKIEDLHFHDLRHEGISRLFERKLSITEVQQVSLHSTWDSLSRYTNLDAGDLDI
jgi:integrase